jgi:hypothetical protein
MFLEDNQFMSPTKPPSVAFPPLSKTITFDIIAIKELRRQYKETEETILELLPNINWNSRLEVKNYFLEEYSLKLTDCRMATLMYQREWASEGSGEWDDLNGLIELYRTQAVIRNYLDCILRHQVGGVVALREIDGQWLMPNKQPISTLQEITDCIISTGCEAE